jgi:hypothetical protein
MTLMAKIYTMLALLLIAFGLGLGLGWKEFRKVPTLANERPAPQIVQKDGSVMLERKSDAAAKPNMDVPKGDKVLRVGKIQWVPSVAATAPTAGSVPQGTPTQPSSLPAIPQTIDWALVKEPDGGERLVVKAEDGTVVGGEDVVISEPSQAAQKRPWAVSVSRQLNQATWGLRVDRDVAFLRLGLALTQVRSDLTGRLSTDTVASVGFTF